MPVHGVLKRGCVQANTRGQPALASHREQRARREVQAAERGDEARRRDGEVDDHGEPVADVARRERVERRRVLRPLAGIRAPKPTPIIHVTKT